jgi:glycosyltransferase involved in cell wall biosynthesis
MTGPLDAFVATNHILGPSRRAKNVVLVHDVGRLRYPELYGFRQVLRMRCMFRRIRRFAHHVVVPTAAMAREVVEIGVAPRERISVVPWFPRLLPKGDAGRPMPGVPQDRPLMLCVATLERHKNIALLIRAFRRAAADLPHDLVVAGGPGSGAREAFEAARGGRVHFVGHIGPEQLGALYRRAELAVCPSLYEGFGLTVLEAMAAGCPVLAADIPAHREVAGDAARLVAPRDERAFADGLRELARDGGARADLRGRGLERSRAFNPTETRRRLRALLQ